MLTFTSETNTTVIRWTDPDIPAQGQYNASYKLCDNNIHTIRLQREQSTIKITIDDHKEESFTIQDGFQLDGDLYIGGVPGDYGWNKSCTFPALTHYSLTQRFILSLNRVFVDFSFTCLFVYQFIAHSTAHWWYAINSIVDSLISLFATYFFSVFTINPSDNSIYLLVLRSTSNLWSLFTGKLL